MNARTKSSEFVQKSKTYFNDELNRYIFFTTVIFIFIITLLAWQSDDAYHAYVMAKNLVLGNGFVYNIGERASASSCPLFTLIIALGYFFIRKMFVVSLLICIIFSTLAYRILVCHFCKTKKQVILSFLLLSGSFCFISYTTSGLENSLLFFLSALFLKTYFSSDLYHSKDLFVLAILISLIAMTRMDAVLLFIPMVLSAFLLKRDHVSFIKAVVIGFSGLLPFICWILFSLFYFGFPFPNTAYVKLGTDIPMIEYLYRGIQYICISGIRDILLLIIPAFFIVAAAKTKKSKYICVGLGLLFYGIYIIRIGGDFMVGRHFTVLFFIALCSLMEMMVKHEIKEHSNMEKIFIAIAALGILWNLTTDAISSQFLFGNTFNSPIADERAGYFKYTSLFNNTLSYCKKGEMVIRDAWNEQGIDELRHDNYSAGILKMVPGITMYYNSDLYLNDLYGLGDPFLSKLPAVREENWRIGHMWREAPIGYHETIMYGENVIENKDISEYYEKIRLITRGDLFDKERLKAIVDINMGKYDYLKKNYELTLDENGKQIPIQ